ncbi:hypothetical protein QC761_701990 [Podospora bellae-mahoneyi]|uniref:DUF5672 domain-containing protein n=1 Tax=Podospora bellae-mahoneyi TaxID=2093777 RepID=A0ABR0F6R7_9PEZI|nr:hypothetical protein QC761_701990 [Podospora bellae-mahoneyi]
MDKLAQTLERVRDFASNSSGGPRMVRFRESTAEAVSFLDNHTPGAGSVRESASGAVSYLNKHFAEKRTAFGEVNFSEKVVMSWQKGKLLGSALWGRTSRRMRLMGGVFVFLALATYLSHLAIESSLITLPSITLTNQKHHYQVQASRYNASKVALLIENRPDPILAPLMLHFMGVVPPDWRFRFMGSYESVAHINKSSAIRSQVAAGKLDLTYIPSNMTTGSQEEISRFLTNRWLYEVVLQPAEWLLVFQTDSILCANSRRNLNEFLEYDWVGAPWSLNARYGGNGGLSLRRVSAIVEVLKHQTRKDGSEPEDVWLSDRLGHRIGNMMANGSVSSAFSGEQHSGNKVDINNPDPALTAPAPLLPDEELPSNGTFPVNGTAGEPVKPYTEGVDDWRHGFYEPMGYHTGGGGKYLHSKVWGTPELRKHIWDYCPEVKMTLKMDAAKFMPGNCNPRWKRGEYLENGEQVDVEEEGEGDEWVMDTEVIDGREYPILRGLTAF